MKLPTMLRSHQKKRVENVAGRSVLRMQRQQLFTFGRSVGESSPTKAKAILLKKFQTRNRSDKIDIVGCGPPPPPLGGRARLIQVLIRQSREELSCKPTKSLTFRRPTEFDSVVRDRVMRGPQASRENAHS